MVDLAQFLNSSGACIKGAGTGTLVISGRKELRGAEFTIIPDRIEAGTFMAAAAITRSCVSLSPVVPSHLTCMIEKLTESGCKITQTGPQTLEVGADFDLFLLELNDQIRSKKTLLGFAGLRDWKRSPEFQCEDIAISWVPYR